MEGKELRIDLCKPHYYLALAHYLKCSFENYGIIWDFFEMGDFVGILVFCGDFRMI